MNPRRVFGRLKPPRYDAPRQCEIAIPHAPCRTLHRAGPRDCDPDIRVMGKSDAKTKSWAKARNSTIPISNLVHQARISSQDL